MISLRAAGEVGSALVARMLLVRSLLKRTGEISTLLIIIQSKYTCVSHRIYHAENHFT